MIFSLAVYAPPYSSEASDTAYRFAEAALRTGHTVSRVFFYHDGIYNANALHCPPQDEANKPQQWRALAKEHGIDMVVCIATALKRGMLDQTEAARYEKNSSNLTEGFNLSGLGQLIDAAQNSDRLISFG
jgi:tRNA 2-thiouridine synthesizing protein D